MIETEYDKRRQAMRDMRGKTCPVPLVDGILCGKPAGWLINAEPICWAHAQEIYLRQRDVYSIDFQRRLASQMTPDDVYGRKG